MAMLTFNHAGTRKPIARILQYVAHPTAIDEDPRIPHADYIFGLAERLERDGGVALYYNGPIADASGAGGDCTYADPNAYEQVRCRGAAIRSEEHTSELQSLMRISYAVFCLKKKKRVKTTQH